MGGADERRVSCLVMPRVRLDVSRRQGGHEWLRRRVRKRSVSGA